MLSTPTKVMDHSRRVIRPSDFIRGTAGNGTIVGDEITRRGLRYVTQLPASILQVRSINCAGLQQLFVQPSVDGILIPADVEIKAAVAIANAIELTDEIGLGQEDFTFYGRMKTLRQYKRSFPSKDPVPAEFFNTIARKDNVEVGAFLRGVRQLQYPDSTEFWSVLLNRVGVGAIFHIHRDRIFAVRSYKGPGTEFLLNDQGDVFQLPPGDLMIFKGDNFYHRQPPPENAVSAYKRDTNFDQRILHSMAVTLFDPLRKTS